MTTGRTFLSAFTPSLMSQEALEAIFVQTRRRVLLERLISDLQFSATTANKKHTLLVGPRGMGKTHLITMLYHRLRSNSENAELDSLIRIAWLNEEERGIPTFGHFVLRVLLKLAEEYKDESLEKQTDSLLDSPSELESRATELLTEWLGRHTLLLIVENFDDILRRMGEQGQRSLRAYLQNKNNTLLLAATPSLTLPLTNYEAPFYGFFNLETLHELDEADALALLRNIADWRKDEELIPFLKTDTALNRIRVIEALAGGHPRIWILFAGVLTKQTLDETVPLFLEMLDDLTPYYQSRLDALSPQQAQVMECLIEKGRSVPVWEIARNCMMEPNSVSVQLRLLGEMGYVRGDKIGRVAYYELREPLMRLCLEVKKSRGKPLQILVDFLRRWYDRNELEGRLALCQADHSYDRMHFQAALELSKNTINETKVAKQYSHVWDLWNNKKREEALSSAQKLVDSRGYSEDHFLVGFCQQELGQYSSAVLSYDRVLELDPNDTNAWSNRGVSLCKLKHIEEGLSSIDRALEIEPKDDKILTNRGNLLLSLAHVDEALSCYEEALGIDPKNTVALCNQGILLTFLHRFGEAIDCFKKAIYFDPKIAKLHFSKAETHLALGEWTIALSCLENGFNLNDSSMNLQLWQLHGCDIWRNLLRFPNDSNLWQERIGILLKLYKEHGVLSEVGNGLVQMLKDLLEPAISDFTADGWNDAFQVSGKPYEEMEIPLRLLNAAVQWKKTPDRVVLLSLRSEERAVLIEALSLTPEEVKGK